MDMQIASAASGMAQVSLTNAWGVGMMKRALEQVEQTGAQLAEMMKSAEVSADGVDIRV